ncbi:MAG: RNA 3'-terminal phosphate cyclase, partial [Candidatus Micrarchaeota archaeon]|nr:RNA 3'-terminal phosphate cyclase [Candidatus Micrarchaeota archaeon]
MMEVDAGHGGGQLLRTALSISALSGKPLSIRNIRQNRPKPGLAAQHLACVNALAKITNAKTKGASLGATSLLFEP